MIRFLLMCLLWTVVQSTTVLRAQDTSLPVALSEEASTTPEGIEDPFEDWNRFSLKMNEGLDTLFFLPVIDLYGAITPPTVRLGVTNCLQNLIEPLWAINFLFQGKKEKSGRSLGRFVINTVFGLLGLFDFASEILGIPPESTDFGSTLQHWGGEPGPYVFWPLLGPSCTRDSFGILMDTLMSPVDLILLWKRKYNWVNAHTALYFTDKKMEYRDTVDSLRKTSLDYYVVLRSLYTQKIATRIKENSTSPQEDGPIPLEDIHDEGPQPLATP